MSDCTTAAARMIIGLDLGDRYSYLCALREDGSAVTRGRVPTTREALQERFGAMQPARVALETGTHSPWVSRLLETCGHEVIVANPRQLRLIFGSRKKSDQLDAEQLARLARVDRKLLAPVRHRTPQGQARLAILRSRDALVRVRSGLVSHVRGIAKSFGLRLPPCCAESFHTKVVDHLPSEVRGSLQLVLNIIKSLTETIREYDKAVERICEKCYPETERLTEVPGVGSLTGLAFVLTIEEPKRILKTRNAGAYVGLAPRRDDSGERSPQLGITKQGDGLLRRLLVGSAHYILGPFGPDTDLRRWGLKLCDRGGKNAKKRAVVAVARKLAVLLLALWKSGKKYKPLRSES